MLSPPMQIDQLETALRVANEFHFKVFVDRPQSPKAGKMPAPQTHPHSKRTRMNIRRTIHAGIILAALFCAAGPWAANTQAQGSRKDDVVFNARGQPLAGATVRVCTSVATTTSPCTPLALIYSDVGLTQALCESDDERRHG